LSQIQSFEDLFTVDAAKLKQVSDHFVKELEKGASIARI
jgi:hexokinase